MTKERIFERNNGRASIQVEAGALYKGGKWIEQPLPCGAKPRLALIHVSSEAVRTKSRKVEPVYKGRKVVAVRLSWWAKNLDQKKATLRELRVSRVGRKARLRGTVETIAPGPEQLPPPPPELPPPGHSGLTEAQFSSLRAKFLGIDIQEMEREFVAWNTEKGVTPDNYTGALYGFIKQKLKRDG